MRNGVKRSEIIRDVVMSMVSNVGYKLSLRLNRVVG